MACGFGVRSHGGWQGGGLGGGCWDEGPRKLGSGMCPISHCFVWSRMGVCPWRLAQSRRPPLATWELGAFSAASSSAFATCHQQHALLPASTSASYSKPEPQNCHVYSSRELGTVWDTAWGIFLVNSEALLVRRLGGWVLCGPAAGAGFRRPLVCRMLVTQRAAVHVTGPGQPVHRAGWPGRGPLSAGCGNASLSMAGFRSAHSQNAEMASGVKVLW